MNKVRRFALGLAYLVTLSVTPVAAASWVYVGENSNGAVIYYDADTIQRSGDQITVWTKWNHSRNRTVRYREAKNRDRFDCTERTITLIAYTNYYPDGKVETFNVPTYGQEDDPVTPESIGETILETVCAATAP